MSREDASRLRRELQGLKEILAQSEDSVDALGGSSKHRSGESDSAQSVPVYQGRVEDKGGSHRGRSRERSWSKPRSRSVEPNPDYGALEEAHAQAGGRPLPPLPRSAQSVGDAHEGTNSSASPGSSDDGNEQSLQRGSGAVFGSPATQGRFSPEKSPTSGGLDMEVGGRALPDTPTDQQVGQHQRSPQHQQHQQHRQHLDGRAALGDISNMAQRGPRVDGFKKNVVDIADQLRRLQDEAHEAERVDAEAERARADFDKKSSAMMRQLDSVLYGSR